MKSHFITFVLSGGVVLGIVGALVWMFSSQNGSQNDNVAASAELRDRVLSAEDVGINTLMNQEIVSARYESLIPTPDYNYDCVNTEEILSLLNTVKDAEFQIADPPTEPIFMMEVVIGETGAGSFAFGIKGGTFVIRINDECKHYTCSKRSEYIQKLQEIQGR